MDPTCRSQLHTSIYEYFQKLSNELKQRENNEDKVVHCEKVLDCLRALFPGNLENHPIPESLTELEIRFAEHPMLEQRVSYLEFQGKKLKTAPSKSFAMNKKSAGSPALVGNTGINSILSSAITLDEISTLLDEEEEQISDDRDLKFVEKTNGNKPKRRRSKASVAEGKKETKKHKCVHDEKEYFNSVEKHELQTAPPHAKLYTGNQWICTARSKYQQYTCKGNGCKKVIRTYCSCIPGRWLCHVCFVSHVREVVV